MDSTFRQNSNDMKKYMLCGGIYMEENILPTNAAK